MIKPYASIYARSATEIRRLTDAAESVSKQPERAAGPTAQMYDAIARSSINFGRALLADLVQANKTIPMPCVMATALRVAYLVMDDDSLVTRLGVAIVSLQEL